MKSVLLVSAIAAVLIFPSLNTAHAADPAAQAAYYGPGVVPRPIDVARALAGSEYRPRIKKRGISFDLATPDLQERAPAATGRAIVKAASAPATGLDVAINFAFDSDQLLTSAYPVLDSLAEGIKLVDGGRVVNIIGHTDGAGGEVYNLQLSNRRANAVRDYLIKQHSIPAARLYGTGRGESELLVPNAPANAKNRRVGFSLS